MRKIIFSGCALIALAVVSGCYTQVHRYASPAHSLPGGFEQGKEADLTQTDTFYITVDTVYKDGDTLFDTTWYGENEPIAPGASAERSLDTVIVEPRIREYCFWIRDFLGYPELRCFSSIAEYHFYLSTTAPWWIRDRMYRSPYYGCPPGFYFDPFSGYCRYYRNFDRFYFPRVRGRDPYRRNNRNAIGQDRRSRSFTPSDGRSRPGGITQPGSGSKTQPPPNPDRRRGRDYPGQSGQAPSEKPPAGTTASPTDQGSGHGGNDAGGEDRSSEPRKDPRRQ
ncbi:MAG: hypothetical protein JXA71_08240 [Chitinispirillaceae bacterium]|nr:hypothetical protein [Chitinispirillaceae bacterium]